MPIPLKTPYSAGVHPTAITQPYNIVRFPNAARLRGWSGDTVWQSWLWCMSRWPECSVAAESRRGEVASILRGTEQKTTIHTLYQSVLSCLIVVSVHIVHKECWRNIRFVVFFNLLGVLIPIDRGESHYGHFCAVCNTRRIYTFPHWLSTS